MFEDDLQLWRAALESGSSLPQLPSDAPSIYRRLASAWQNGSATDVAVLLRHVLRAESERSKHSQILLVDGRDSRFANWTSEQWECFGLDARILEEPCRFRLSALPWRPKWLEIPSNWNESSPEAAAFAGRERRSFTSATGDPAIEPLGRATYLCPGQKSAVRAVLAMPAGATLLVNLPTGSGKSLCAQVLAAAPFVRDENAGVVVVAVPTTALCLDQARAVQKLAPHDCAYHEGLSSEARNAIRARLYAGEQRILFASPESLLQSLRPALYGAARSGFLRALVVDEAHMIEQWGDEFRPAFQELAGLRRGLQREAAQQAPHAPALRTILLSATWTASSVETVKALFGDELAMTAAVQLRPEPSLWMAPCEATSTAKAEALRGERVLEALRHLPRPLVLYTSKVEDADRWEQRLRDSGFSRRRLAKMTGQTPTNERGRIIDQWARGELDMVVATSAFGLGIDQSEVRAVVHACVPENLDRFYQEIGRGGRDGRASISLMVYTRLISQYHWRRKSENDDLTVARGIGKKRIITLSKGLERWKAMFESKNSLGNGRYRVSLDAQPRLDMGNSHNRDWNSRTLTLMSRAGVLTLDDEAPSQEEMPKSENAPSLTTRLVTINDDRHLEEAFWRREVEPQRLATARAQRASWKQMLQLLAGDRCASEILAESYSLSVGLVSSRAIPVARSCGGCPACRRLGVQPFSHVAVPTRFPWKPLHLLGESARGFFGNGSFLVIFYEESATKLLLPRLSKLLGWSIKQGVRGVIAPPQWQSALLQGQTKLLASRGVFVLSPDELGVNVPTILFAEPGADLDWTRWKRRLTTPATYAPLILVLPANTPDPARPDRLMSEMATFPFLRLKEWEVRASA